MRPIKLVTAVAAAVAVSATGASPAVAACAGADVRPAADNLHAVRAATLCLLNEQRAARGLAGLALNSRLTEASDAYSERMVREGFFAHDTPDGVGLVDRLVGAGYLGSADDWLAGENIGWGEGRLATPRAMMDAWMDSPGHRANILEPRFREVGVGVALGSPSSGPVTTAATYTTDFGMVDAAGRPVTRQPGADATAATPSTTAKTTAPKRVKRKCPRGKRLVVKRKGKRVQRRCVAKRTTKRR
jgi:uncharacterized protein YkwD